ncbi:MAG: DUF5330 domain-containing protein [Parvibaculaceae bacterium]|nr:DUF5330 domain-containing protein [Parvibaculaceae bacterium]
MFLIRATFWLALAAFVLPQIASGLNAVSRGTDQEASPPQSSGVQRASTNAPDTVALFSAAVSSAEDLAGFCGRNPDTCATASATFAHMIDNTAHYGGIALDWAVTNLAEQAAKSDSGTSAEPFFNQRATRAQNEHIGIPLQRPTNARG